ncbi:MAG: thiamine-phosphate kinase [Ignavibacteriales bacterium]
MKVAEIGEFGLIDRWMKMLESRDPRIIVGAGDDAAVLQPSPGRVLVATCDMMVEGVHFLASLSKPRQVGLKAMAMNLSDLAAMNASPLAALISVALTPDLDVAFVDELYAGLSFMADRFGCPVAGGDTVRSMSSLVIDVFVAGEADRERMTLRSGASPGDIVLVTGHLGESAAGLDLLLAGGGSPPPGRGRRARPDCPAGVSPGAAAEVIRAHLTPVPRLAEARAISEAGGATAAIDISDGLANEVNHIARMSGVGIVVDAGSVPLSPATAEVARALGKDPLHYALFGGEDYELCLTAHPSTVDSIVRAVRDFTGTPITPIGRVIAKKGCWLSRDGRHERLPAGAWDHFRKGNAHDEV